MDTPGKRPDWHYYALAGVTAAVLAASLTYWAWARNHESTDDAAIDASVAAVNSKVRGQVLRISVADNQGVAQGDLLLEIDPADYQVKAGQARAELQASQAEAVRASADAARYEQLFKADQISRQAHDKTVADADVAKARVEVARQKLAAAELDLSYTRITAPLAGHVARRAVEVKSFVEVGQPLMAVVPDAVYVTANFKETQLTRMKPGQKVAIRVDTYRGRVFKGHIDSIQAGTGARFSLMPPENATGNLVKVVQRVPVKIVFDEPTTGFVMAPGMSVEPTVDLR